MRDILNLIEAAQVDIEEGREPFLVPAVRYNGKVYRGNPGEDHFHVMSRLPDDIKKGVGMDNDYRGFVSHTGHFLNRNRAMDYAKKHGLLGDHNPSWVHDLDRLVSEYLTGYDHTKGRE